MSTTKVEVYTVQLTDEQLRVVGAGLGEVPYKLAKPVIEAIQAQVNEQEAAWRKAREEAALPKDVDPPQGP